jgi:hypothetical protein
MMEKKTAPSTNVVGRSGYPSTKSRNYIHVYHPILVSSENGSRT